MKRCSARLRNESDDPLSDTMPATEFVTFSIFLAILNEKMSFNKRHHDIFGFI
jgi:hypothetical protein